MTDAIASPSVKTVEFDGVMENAYGSKLDKAIKFDGTYEHILNFESIPAKEQLSNEDILKVVNDARKANARQKAMQDALDANDIKKPTLENNSDLQVKTMVKSLVASGKYNEESATAFARTALGL